MGLPHAVNAGNRRGIAMVVAGVFALSGVSVIAWAATHQVRAPEAPFASVVTTTTPSVTPPATTTDSATGSATGSTGSATASPTQVPGGVALAPQPGVAPGPASKMVGRVMPASMPVSLAIPAIDVNSSGMLRLGQNAQGALQVPPPGPDYDKVAWYRNSPTPGSLGPAVLVGHIDSAAKGPSVFFRLGALKRGDLVRVTRADKSVAVFKIDDVKRFRKRDFPTALVYGNTDHAALRIITCGGPFDRDSGSYVDNTIVMASLI